ncbi:MAG: putative DNA binding domain-containing protein [Lachnospiraceae bacterium]|nr:putative DNA binding domain-containing protein [Lachnospiraceae bacterium]
MMNFEYDKTAPEAQYYEVLGDLIERWEYEIVEFKEAKGNYNTDRAGQYFSAISNEANLKHQQYGWFVLGVSESQEKYPVGTNFKRGETSLLEKFKYEISQNMTDGATYLDIIEIAPVYQGKTCRVLMFKIPAAATGMPTAWKNRYYARSGESIVSLSQIKIDIIRSQERMDWSRQVLEGARLEHLDPEAIKLARAKYLEKMNRPHIAEEVSRMTDEQFLTKIKLMIDGKVTNAAMVLLGNPDYDYLFSTPPTMMWRLYGADGANRDYAIFTIPFISVVDKIMMKIRNLTYRYMPNQMTLFPLETKQYDLWMLRELLNNCIAHSNYQLGGRIYLNEFDEQITITNPGEFLPEKVEKVLRPGYNPPFYRNQLLAASMVNFNMIDTQSSGIQKVYRIQRDKYFPMPDYDFSTEMQVGVTVYGKSLNEAYMYILFDHPEMPLETVFLLDRVQKGREISKEAADYLRKQKMIEGRYPKIYPSAEASKVTNEETKYIRNKAFDDQYYKDLIIQYLRTYQKANKAKIRELLWDKLPEILSDAQKNRKINYLLTSMRETGLIVTDSPNQQKCSWVLK